MNLAQKIAVIVVALAATMTAVYYSNNASQLNQASSNIFNAYSQLTSDVESNNQQISSISNGQLMDAMLLDNMENQASFKMTTPQLANGQLQNGAGCHVSAYQGVEVHFDSLVWNNLLFSKDNGAELLTPLNGTSSFFCNKMVFDPDLPDRGYPDIVGTLAEPTVFDLNKFLKKPLKSYQISKPLNFSLSSSKPVDTQTWKTKVDGIPTKIRMETWLLEFDMVISVKPASRKNNDLNVDKNLRSRVTGQKVKHMRDERDNYEYGALDIFLKFLPKTQNWYIENDAQANSLYNKGDLNIGIAAVEVIYLNPSKNKLNKNQGEASVYLEKGGSLALTTDINDFPKRGNKGLRQKDAVISTPQDLKTDIKGLITDNGMLDPNLFNQPKYAVVTFPNIGTWHKKGGWFTKEQLFSDQIEAKLLIHTFVVGQWQLKREKYVDFEAPAPISYVKASTFERALDSAGSFFKNLIPDLGLDFLSYTFWPVIILILILLVFPQFFGLLLSGIIKAVRGIFKAGRS